MAGMTAVQRLQGQTSADVVAAVILCQCDAVAYSFIHRRRAVSRRELVAGDLVALVEQTNRLSAELLRS